MGLAPGRDEGAGGEQEVLHLEVVPDEEVQVSLGHAACGQSENECARLLITSLCLQMRMVGSLRCVRHNRQDGREEQMVFSD
jgi:hypothetical protein